MSSSAFLNRITRAMRHRGIIMVMLIASAYLISYGTVFAHSSFSATPPIPNYSKNTCSNCHGGASFKSAFAAQSEVWNTTLANLDSDNDGFTNGEELQDRNGTWTIGMSNPGSLTYVTLPGSAASMPSAPSITDIGGFSVGVGVGGNLIFSISTNAPFPASQVTYTVKDGSNQTVYSYVSSSAPFTSDLWDTTLVSDGDYTVTADYVEARKKVGVTPRTATRNETITVKNTPDPNATRFVATTGTDTGTCASSAAPCATISYAIDQAIDGDEIRVAAGTYFNAYSTGKSLTLTGGFTTSNWTTPDYTANQTILDGNDNGGNPPYSRLGIYNAAAFTIQGFTVRNAGSNGINAQSNTNLVIRNNRFENNNGNDGSGGNGIYVLANDTVTIQDNVIANNTYNGVANGGGAQISNSGSQVALVLNNTFENNSTGGPGGAIYFDGWDGTGSMVMSGNTFINNSASLGGGGVFVHKGHLTSTNDLFVNNSAPDAGGGAALGTDTSTSSSIRYATIAGSAATDAIQLGDGSKQLTLINTLISGYTTGIKITTSDSEGTLTLQNVLMADDGANNVTTTINNTTSRTVTGTPLRGTAGYVGNDDYHLIATSDAINAGITVNGVTTDQDGDTRPQDSAPDIGMDEFVPANVSITAGDPSAAEASLNTGTFTVTRDGSTTDPLTVNYTVSGTAGAGTDYTTLSGSVTILAGASSAIITVTPINDVIQESAETVIITLASGTGYLVSTPSSDTVMIADNDTPTQTVSIDVAASSISEAGPAGSFIVTRSGSTAAQLQVNYTVGGTATSASDYTALSGSVTIAAGASSASITLTPVNDATQENNESVILTLASGSYTIGAPSAATMTITDNDSSTQTVSISAVASSISEGGPAGTFTVTRSGGTTGNLVVNYTVGGTATSGSDYTALSGKVTILAGASSATITLTPVNNALFENTETVIVTLASGSYTIGAPSSAQISILDNDTASQTVGISAASNSISESGPAGTFTVTRSGAIGSSLTVNYTVSGTADSGSDYTALSGSVTFAAGVSSTSITLTPINDQVSENSEIVIITLSPGGSYTVGTPSSATITIADNDNPIQTVSISTASSTISEAGPAGTVTIIRNGVTTAQLQVNYTVSGTASSGTDYTTLSGSVTIAAGASSATITLTPVNDATQENNETVIVTLASGSYTIGAPGTATMTITDNDSPTQTVSISTATGSIVEGDSAGTFTVTRSGGTTGNLVVNYTIGGTATSGSDYTALSGKVTIAAGASSATITLTPVSDSTSEGNETVVVTLANGSYTTGSPSSATITIRDSNYPIYLPAITRS